jgi:parallel beta-helix repeat protein
MLIGSINTIEDNFITHNTKDGIYLNADDNTLIQTNTIAHNTQTGIRLYNSTTGIIRTNTIHHNIEYGIYLDFFVINTTIYNNYLHHNTQNAIDKSINRNHWNQTPTITTNIVGGNITAGNYWDDFDELNEGITDTNNNGICDTSYTIYNLNRDYAPLLDTTPPTIQTITINPTSQTEGSPTNIQTIITDNTEIKSVHLVITTPTGTIRNLTITQNQTGNTYSCNTEFSPVGTFNFSVYTKDPLNWQQSTRRTFHILEGSPPTITDNSPTTGSPSHSFTFNASIKDDIDPASDLNVTVQWQHGTKRFNTTLEHQGKNYFTEKIHLDSSLKPLTYTITAADHWGNSRTTTSKTVTITDTEPPIITIHQYTPTSEDPPNTFTFTVSIIDNTQVNKVYMDYWYPGSSRYTVDMDTAGNGRYTKTIVPATPQERIYCIIYANDTSDNLNTTMNPNALPGGPYYGFVKTDLLLNATDSFDLDGNITQYSWNFGDGTTGNGTTTTHQYLSSGIYTIRLTVTDDDENTHTQTTTATINYFTTTEPSLSTQNYIQNRYNISLPHTFYCFDSDGDTIMDSFVDPNGILIHLNQFTISTNEGPAFALSIDDMYIPEFLWFIETDEIQSIDYETGIVDNIIVDETTDHAIVYITVDKKEWLYLEVNDQYPDATLTISTQNRTIPESMIWRINNRIYLLDDATTSYIFDYLGIIPPLTHPEFKPSEGSVIDANHSTITITYDVPVNINSANFGTINIINELETGDNQIFFYTPPGYLADDTYTLSITASSIQGNNVLTSNVVYFYFAYTEPPPPTIFELYGDYMIMAFIAAASIGLVLVLNIKQITLDGFIYFNNKRILPFFKTIVLGPVSVHVDNEQISKAEFYVDSQLKHVLTEPPYLWHWNEHAVLKHTLETKVYDAAGNNVSSGEMEMYVFNVYRNTKF